MAACRLLSFEPRLVIADAVLLIFLGSIGCSRTRVTLPSGVTRFPRLIREGFP